MNSLAYRELNIGNLSGGASPRVLHNPRQPPPRRVLMRKKLVNFVDVRGRHVAWNSLENMLFHQRPTTFLIAISPWLLDAPELFQYNTPCVGQASSPSTCTFCGFDLISVRNFAFASRARQFLTFSNHSLKKRRIEALKKKKKKKKTKGSLCANVNDRLEICLESYTFGEKVHISLRAFVISQLS